MARRRTRLIIHCGGVQSRASLQLDEATHARVIGAHPLAGSHDSGFGAARADLFAGCTVSIESRASRRCARVDDVALEAVGATRLDYRSAERARRDDGVDQPPPAARVDGARGDVRGGAHRSRDASVRARATRRGSRRARSISGRRSCRRSPPCSMPRSRSWRERVASIRAALAKGDSTRAPRALEFGARVAPHARSRPRDRRALEIRVPGDKSLSHRALIFAALATGRSRVRDILQSADVQSTAGVLRALGVAVPPLGDDIIIDARGARAMLAPTRRSRLRQQRHDDAAHGGRRGRMRLSHALHRRREPEPASDAARGAPARAMGARVELEAGDGLPMTIHGGALAVDRVDIRDGERADQERDPARGRRWWRRRGGDGAVALARSHRAHARARWARDVRRRRDARARMRPCASSIAARHSRAGRSIVGGVPRSRSRCSLARSRASRCRSVPQPYAHWLLRRAPLEWARDVSIDERRATRAGSRRARFAARTSELARDHGRRGEVPSMIDELPLLACVARARRGQDGHRRRGGAAREGERPHRRRGREPARDRRRRGGAARMGCACEGSRRPLRGRVVTHGDHRIAMAFGVLGALPGNEIEIDDPCVRRGVVSRLLGRSRAQRARERMSAPTPPRRRAFERARLARRRDRRTGGVGQVVDRAVGRAATRLSPRRFGGAVPRGDRRRARARRRASSTSGRCSRGLDEIALRPARALVRRRASTAKTMEEEIRGPRSRATCRAWRRCTRCASG